MATAFAVYVGAAEDQRTNLQHGLDTGSWGFTHLNPPIPLAASADFLIHALNYRGNTRQLSAAAGRTLDVVVSRITGPLYAARAPHWPDEVANGAVRYAHRFGIAPLMVFHDVPLDPAGPLPAGLIEGFRLSNTRRGAPQPVTVDLEPLMSWADIAPDGVQYGTMPGVEGGVAGSSGSLPSGHGRRLDAAANKAVEERSLVVTEAALHKRGATGLKRVGKPYDLRCQLDGAELHIEVKGTTGSGAVVELTSGEVRHASEHTTWLAVVNDIKLSGTGTNPVVASGGSLRLFEDWRPASGDLRVTRYDYQVPRASQ